MDALNNRVLEPRIQGMEATPPRDLDPVVEVYKKDVDRTLLRRNLKLTPAERAEQLVKCMEFVAELRRGEARLRARTP